MSKDTFLPFRPQAIKEAKERYSDMCDSDAFFRGAMWAQTVLRAEQSKCGACEDIESGGVLTGAHCAKHPDRTEAGRKTIQANDPITVTLTDEERQAVLRCRDEHDHYNDGDPAERHWRTFVGKVERTMLFK